MDHSLLFALFSVATASHNSAQPITLLNPRRRIYLFSAHSSRPTFFFPALPSFELPLYLF